MYHKNFVLLNKLIKVELPLWKIWKADISSDSPSSQLIIAEHSKCQLSISFILVIWLLSTCLIKLNFHVSLSHRHSTTFSQETRNLSSVSYTLSSVSYTGRQQFYDRCFWWLGKQWLFNILVVSCLLQSWPLAFKCHKAMVRYIVIYNFFTSFVWQDFCESAPTVLR